MKVGDMLEICYNETMDKFLVKVFGIYDGYIVGEFENLENGNRRTSGTFLFSNIRSLSITDKTFKKKIYLSDLKTGDNFTIVETATKIVFKMLDFHGDKYSNLYDRNCNDAYDKINYVYVSENSLYYSYNDLEVEKV